MLDEPALTTAMASMGLAHDLAAVGAPRLRHQHGHRAGDKARHHRIGQASLHESLGLARADELDGPCRRFVAVLGVLDRQPGEAESRSRWYFSCLPAIPLSPGSYASRSSCVVAVLATVVPNAGSH